MTKKQEPKQAGIEPKESKPEKHHDKQDEKQREIDELTETLKRLQAEFENYQKRIAKENAEYRKFATESFMKKLLPVLDSFEHAMKHANNGNSNNEKLKEGITFIYQQLLAILKEEGVRKMETIGKQFDSNKEEVLLTEPSHTPNIVLEEFQSGYMFNERVLRHAKVKIGVSPEEKDSKENTQEDQHEGT